MPMWWASIVKETRHDRIGRRTCLLPGLQFGCLGARRKSSSAATDPMADAGTVGGTVNGATTLVPPMVRFAELLVITAAGNRASGIIHLSNGPSQPSAGSIWIVCSF